MGGKQHKFNMASLIVQLHELTNEYIKRAKNKDIAGEICSEILLRSREVAKKYLWDGGNACMFYVAPLYPILSRELLQWNNIIKRRMKAILKANYFLTHSTLIVDIV